MDPTYVRIEAIAKMCVRNHGSADAHNELCGSGFRPNPIPG